MKHQIVPSSRRAKEMDRQTLLEPGAAPALGLAQSSIPPGKGRVLTAVQVFSVYWGTYWGQAEGSSLAAQLDGFMQFVVTSPLIDQLAEYNSTDPNNPQQIGYGAFAGSVTITNGAPGADITDNDVRQFLQDQFAAPGQLLPQPNPELVYFVFLPPGTTITSGTEVSCADTGSGMCGYHWNDGPVLYAVIPHQSCPTCLEDLSVLDATTAVISHELCEAITDPDGDGWVDLNAADGGEIGDPCTWVEGADPPQHNVKKMGGYVVQRMWSNNSNGCV